MVPQFSLHIAFQHGGESHDDDTFEHEIHLNVAQTDGWLITAIVQSDAYANPRVIRYERRGDVGLSDEVLNAVVVACFKRAAKQMLTADGDRAEVWVADAGGWLEAAIGAEHARLACEAFAPLAAGPSVTADASWVMQD